MYTRTSFINLFLSFQLLLTSEIDCGHESFKNLRVCICKKLVGGKMQKTAKIAGKQMGLSACWSKPMIATDLKPGHLRKQTSFIKEAGPGD